MEQVDLPEEVVRVGEHTLTLRNITALDQAAVVNLHTLVFGPQVNAQWFAWKYGDLSHQGRGQAVGAWHGDNLIAFCGGVPRTLALHGKTWSGLQLADVMVHPSWRGILTRKGPFYHASSRFYRSRMGPAQSHPFQLAFGFGSRIHVRLAVTVGLGWDSGQMQMLHWPVADSGATATPWTWRWQEISPNDKHFEAHVNTAWEVMKNGANGLTLGHHDAAYLRWRFVDRPPEVNADAAPRYRFFMLRRPWSRIASGVAVMDLRSTCAQWLDWIGPIGLMPIAAHAARYQAAQSGARELTAWASPAVVQQLENTGVASREVCAWLGIPATSDLKEQDVAGLGWWLMGGDTDFL